MTPEQLGEELYLIGCKVWPSTTQKWLSASAAVRDNWTRFAKHLMESGWSKQ